MWIAVLLVLLISGTIFYGLARYYMSLQEFKKSHNANKGTKSKTNIEKEEIPGE